LAQYKHKRLKHLPGWKTLDTKRKLDYRPIGRRPGRPLKRPLDGYNHDAQTGNLLA